VPVVDADNRVAGVVSEGDLLHRVETGTEQRTGQRRSWWLDTIASDRGLARDYVKSHGLTVKDVMTRDVVPVTDTTELADIANLLETKWIKRVSVVRRQACRPAERTWCGLWRRRRARRRSPADLDDRTVGGTHDPAAPDRDLCTGPSRRQDPHPRGLPARARGRLRDSRARHDLLRRRAVTRVPTATGDDRDLAATAS
jgi:CBS domain-containing protein